MYGGKNTALTFLILLRKLDKWFPEKGYGKKVPHVEKMRENNCGRIYLETCSDLGLRPVGYWELPDELHARLLSFFKNKNPNAATRKALRKSIVRAHLWIANDHRCYSCGKNITFSEVTRDHVFPKTERFTIYRNLAPCCHDCNQQKDYDWPKPSHIFKAWKIHRRMGWNFNPQRHNATIVETRFAPKLRLFETTIKNK